MHCLVCNGRLSALAQSQPKHTAAVTRPLACVRQPKRAEVCLQRHTTAPSLLQPSRGEHVKMHAGPVDAMPTWTLDQIAGLAFGALMVAFYFGAQQIDVYIAKQQRRELGLCEECGGVYNPDTCKRDKCPLKAKVSS